MVYNVICELLVCLKSAKLFHCSSVLAVSAIFLKNCRPGPLLLANVHLCTYSILYGYSLVLRPVNQQQKQLAVRSNLGDTL